MAPAWIECPECEGHGHQRAYCGPCGGDGEQTIECEVCLGAGRVDAARALELVPELLERLWRKDQEIEIERQRGDAMCIARARTNTAAAAA